MAFRFFTFLFLFAAIGGCVSKRSYILLAEQNSRIKNDSLLLEKRIRQLNDENVRLATESARMEQAMNNRLQEKEDSLTYKETLLRERELSLIDMKARKEEEQEAFTTLVRQIRGDFSDYDKLTLTTHANCTQIIVSVNEKELFIAGGTKTEYLATEVTNKAVQLLNKYPDLNLAIICYADSNSISPKEKSQDVYQNTFMKANVLYRLLNVNKTVAFKIKTEMGVKSEQHFKYYPSQIDYVFYSALLPCIHSR